MKPIDKRLLLQYAVIDLTLSSFLVLAMWYTGRFIEGILSKMGLILFTPGFLLLVLLQTVFQGKGTMEAMDDYSYTSLLIVSFIFYFVVIALIQVFFLQKKKTSRRFH